MLIQSRQSAVEISSAFESTAFTIVDSKNSFALLQGKHYENPSIAVLRALVENALDTQREATSEKPIEILIGRAGDLSVKDHGTGISPEVFEQHFTVFFASNRTESNDYHGVYGMGAKAPFSIASIFFVTTIHEGIQYEWACKHGDPAPSAVLLNESITTEPSGTQISFNVFAMKQYRSLSHWQFEALKMQLLMPNHIVVLDQSSQDKKPFLSSAVPGLGTVTLNGKVYSSKEFNSRAGFLGSSLTPTVYVGDMPYPLPDSRTMDLPEELYLSMESRVPLKTVPSRKRFGSSNNCPSNPEFHTHVECVQIHTDIGELDLHFSKERLAHTAQNIGVLREKALAQWLNMQWSWALKFSSAKVISGDAWRMPSTAAAALLLQGKDKGILAWATRPLDLEGLPAVLNADQVPFVIKTSNRNHKLPSDAWLCTNVARLNSNEMNMWRTTWGLGEFVMKQDPKYNAVLFSYATASEHNYARLDHAVYDTTYANTLEHSDTANALVVCIDLLPPGMLKQSLLQQIIVDAQVDNVIITSLTAKEVKNLYPNALLLEDTVRKFLNTLSAHIPGDALGQKTVYVSYDQRNRTPAWVASVIDMNHVLVAPESSVGDYEMLQAWANASPVQYVALDMWIQEKKKAFPILNIIGPDGFDQAALYITELLSTS